MKEATGKYVKVLDADDSFDTKSLEKFIEILTRTDVDLVLSDAVLVNEEDEQTDYWKVKAPRNTIFQFQESPAHVQMYCVAYKTINLKKIGYTQMGKNPYTDQEWIYWPLSTVKTAYYVVSHYIDTL